MEPIRVKMNVAGHEIDVEGPPESVDPKFEAWRSLVELALNTINAANVAPPTPPTPPPPSDKDAASGTQPADTALDRIMKVDDRIVSLTVKASTIDDAALLILFGQKVFRNNDSVTGWEVIQGLTHTGQTVARPDRVLEKMAQNGLVISTGLKRGRRYRLSNSGFARSKKIAGELIATVA